MKCFTNIPKNLDSIIIPIDEKSDFKSLISFLKEFDISLAKNAQGDIKGQKDELNWFYGKHQNQELKICIVGLGEKPEYSISAAAFKKTHHTLKEKLGIRVGIYTDMLSASAPKMIEAFINGWVQGGYDIALYKSDKTAPKDSEICVIGQSLNEESYTTAVHKGQQIGLTQTSIFNLVNAPSNKKTPEELAAWAIQSAQKNNFTCHIIEKDELIKLGMHALLAVNRGSEVPAKCIVLEYVPKDYTKTIAIIGKGITFDTGGLSIKGSNNMHYMKSDMGGAAATLGALELAAKLKIKHRVIGIVPTTDNSVDALAIKPGDVISSYAGKTIEVIDTDAEGRLVLADGLAYAVDKYQPDHMLDLATLTGSIIGAIGTEAAGLFTKNDALAKLIETAGNNTGELVWRMPMWDSYSELMQSDIADIRNLSTKPMAGSITAAKFLEIFTNEHKSWAHLDIAGMAFGPNSLSKGYSATAFGVRLLVDVLENI